MVYERSVVEEVSGWLRVFDDGSVDRTYLGPPEAKFMAEPVPAHDGFIDGVAVRDVVIGDEEGHNQRVRIYLPERGTKDSVESSDNDDKLPIVLHLHGGGFCISQADWYMYYAVYTNIARSTDAIVVSPYLRLAPEHRLPAAIDDSFSALLWLSSVAAEADPHAHKEPWLSAHADFKRVFLIGDSSGGNLVHEVAVRASESQLGLLTLAGAIPIHPGFCRAKRSNSELEMPQSPFLTSDMVDKFLMLALPVGSTKDHPITCPMGSTAPPVSQLRLPPIMLCLAEHDLLMDTEMEYYEAMKEAGKDIELFVSKGMTHSFYLNKIVVDMDPNTKIRTEQLFQQIACFVKRH